MPDIKKLSDVLVKKIAAGEVIERPASVVKELLENAIDAGAARIQLAIQDGGRKLIRVTDDGCGMAASQLPLAVAAHATSKIRQEEDLFRIGTLGFRGEALASIGSVSHLTLRSRPEGALEGAELYVAGEQLHEQEARGCPTGTTVEVRDLFYNVPARRKFMKGANTEFGHIQEQLARVALPNPQIEFEFISGSKTIKHLRPVPDALQRIHSFYGQEISEALLPIDRCERSVSISGYMAKPALNRNSTKWQYVFLGGRYIRDRFVQHAIKEAFRGLIEHSRHPVVFLMIDLPADRVDVNVHPTKIEVRWQDSSQLYSQVLSALRETLLKQDLTPALSTRAARTVLTDEQRLEERRKIAAFFKQATPTQASDAPPLSSAPSHPTASVEMNDLALVFQSPGQAVNQSVELAETSPADRNRRAALQLHRTYLVTEAEDGMLVIDQHALHERVLYERLRERIAAGNLESQRLLLPEVVQLTAEHVALMESHSSLLGEIGVEVSVYGRDAVAVLSFPALLGPAIIQDFMRDVADRLADDQVDPHTEQFIHALLESMACKAAVKAGDELSADEIADLIAQRHLVEKSSNCPHGRPTTLRLTLSDLERQFKRK